MKGMIDEDHLKSELRAIGAWDESGHYEYSSGRHGNTHLDKYTLSIYPRALKLIGKAMAEAAQQWNPDVVVSPAYSGISLSQWTAVALDAQLDKEVLALYVVKLQTPGGFTFRFIGKLEEYLNNKRVVILEDNINTGYSIGIIKKLIEESGGQVVGAVSLMNRGKVTLKDGLPLVTLLTSNFRTWLQPDCQLCPNPITTPYIRKLT
jgi:orotate phosphoribosyltransferase